MSEVAWWVLGLVTWALGVVPTGAWIYRDALGRVGRSDAEFFAVLGGLVWPMGLAIMILRWSLGALCRAMKSTSGAE